MPTVFSDTYLLHQATPILLKQKASLFLFDVWVFKLIEDKVATSPAWQLGEIFESVHGGILTFEDRTLWVT